MFVTTIRGSDLKPGNVIVRHRGNHDECHDVVVRVDTGAEQVDCRYRRYWINDVQRRQGLVDMFKCGYDDIMTVLT